jgi:phage terminase large subunit-like protein
MRRTKAHQIDHGGNPVARWMAGIVEVRSPADQPDVIRPVKPDREKSAARIDGIVAEAMAIGVELRDRVELPAPLAASGAASPSTTVFRPTERLKI